jgi:YVTN family beta-propeller protein
MHKRKLWMQALALSILTVPFALSSAERWTAWAANKSAPLATRSSPIAITSDDRFVWSVNPDNDSVSVFRVTGDANMKIAEIGVGKEPWCVAITPDDDKVYVTNMASGTVSVINAHKKEVIDTIHVGTEPFGCALTPNGRKLYVANQSSDTVSVINTRHDRVVETIRGVGPKPHGVAITADGKKVFVTQFLALPRTGDPRPLTQTEGADDGREGRVTVINAQNDSVIDTVILNPIANTGFLSDGSTLGREPTQNPAVFDNVTGAFPNLLESVTIKGDIAYVPGTCASPNGPFRFNVNVQSCLSTIDTGNNDEAFPTLNMNFGVQNEPVGVKLFNTNPFAVAFKASADEGFIAIAATNRLLRVTLNDDGSATINPPASPADPSRIVRIELKDPAEIALDDPADVIGGKNPRGLVLNSTDTRAYVMDFLSRDIAIVDISGSDPTQYKTLQRVQSADLPTSAEDLIVHRGKYLFNTSVGPEGTADNSKRPAGLMSDFGWGTCYGCHPQALTDSVTWMFADGPRQAISMESTFEFGAAQIVNGAPQLPDSHQRALNWSAVRDEVQDFTRNVRAVSGGGGLIKVDANGNPVPEGAAGLAQLPDLAPTANSGLSADLDAIATYLALGVRAPISPVNPFGFAPRLGRLLFEVQGCQNCHGGPNWTISTLDYTPPAVATDIVDAQLFRFLCKVGTFDPGLFADGVSNEIRANNAMNVQARGAIGINVPSLISVFAGAPYLHSGAAPTLEDVLNNVTHRTAGRPDHADILSVPLFRRLVVQFLRSIDRNTDPFLNVTPPVDVCGTGTP